MMVFSTFVASISEDILTRGFIKRALPSLGARSLFIPVSAALYVLNHIYRLGNGPLEWLQLFCYGLAYAAALHYSGSLWPAVGLHWGWNFANSLADTTLQVDRLSDVGGPLLSAGTHVILFFLVLASAPKLFRSGSYRSVMS
jgi:membrane protease YdiL (CAAX protease family)